MSNFVSQLVNESKEIRAKGATIRGQAISSQIRAGIILCMAARQASRRGNSRSANKTLDRVAHAIDRIQHHLSEPKHVPTATLPALRSELERLEEELRATQADLHRSLLDAF